MDLKVNDKEWASLGADERSRIESIVAGFFQSAKIVPDPSVAPTAQPSGPAAAGNPFCEAACNIAETAAKAACASLGNPIAIAACIAVAEQGGKLCRSKC